jgi:hypothetical protein
MLSNGSRVANRRARVTVSTAARTPACNSAMVTTLSPSTSWQAMSVFRGWPDTIKVHVVSDQDPAIRAAIVDVFRCRSHPWIWLWPVLTIVFTAISTACLIHAGDSAWLGVGGIAALVAAGAIPAMISWADRQIELGDKRGAERLRVAMKDALQPVAELIAEMPALTPAKREARLKQVAQQAVGALCLLLKDVDRLRAVVYRVDGAGTSMPCLGYSGRGAKPDAFVAGTPRGDSALNLVRTAGHLFCADVVRDRPAQYGGTVSDYRTFISAAVSNGPSAYGMVTVDAPNAGDLVDTDAQLVLLMADLMAIAFAIEDSAK